MFHIPLQHLDILACDIYNVLGAPSWFVTIDEWDSVGSLDKNHDNFEPEYEKLEVDLSYCIQDFNEASPDFKLYKKIKPVSKEDTK